MHLGRIEFNIDFSGRRWVGMVFVPEGQHDRSQARSAWNHDENSLVPAGRLNDPSLD
jgi:hypothetical protein